jgi:hypothetical protein
VRGYENIVFFALQISNVFAAVIVYLTNSGSVSSSATKILIYVLVALAGGVLITFVTVAIAAVVMGPGAKDQDWMTGSELRVLDWFLCLFLYLFFLGLVRSHSHTWFFFLSFFVFLDTPSATPGKCTPVTRAGSLKTRTNTPMMALRRPVWPQLRRGSWRRLRHSLAARLPPTTQPLRRQRRPQPLREGPGARSPSCPRAPRLRE